jgi:branched-chain amino acid transport system permease protein
VLTLRLGGHFLPLSTIAWGLSIALLFGNVDAFGRHTGLANVPPLRIGRGRWSSRTAIYYLIWATVGSPSSSTATCCSRGPGRAIRGLRGGAVLLRERRRRRVPRAPHAVRLAALLAGLAGWLYAHMNRFVSPSPFDVRASIEYLLMAVGGGLGQLSGALAGAGGRAGC